MQINFIVSPMHLKQLKLSGFKSFVDPTIVPFPSQLVAVVGPNGCGKSNVIDAVRWVMGESSAKNLRGESMVDVIFNGSSNRKPVGQASVELVFDNSLGRLTGQYASYQEIAVKRLVTRDGESSYFLNGTRCRRRDITDIFLGTGAGSRGYSIIGQGTISRLVEARPEELRAFLEEAAGISKYKERRRETLTRINHTRENLLRVADIREELGKQLQRLERQARAASRYQLLKQEERACKADILALKWQALKHEQASIEDALTRLTLNYEQHQAASAEAYKRVTSLREKNQAENDSFQTLQASFYQLNTEIALLEETIQQSLREKQRLIEEQQQQQADWQTLKSQLQQDSKTLQDSEVNRIQIISQLETMRADLEEKQRSFQDIQQQTLAWQKQSEQAQRSLANATREVDLAKVKQNHLVERRQEIQRQLEKIHAEHLLVNDRLNMESLDKPRADLRLLRETLHSDENKDQSLQALGAELRAQLADTEKKLHQQQDDFHRLKAREAALAASLRQAIGQGDKSDNAEGKWASNPRLIEVMSVEKTWQNACEIVMGASLKAIVVDSMELLWSDMSSLQGHANVYTTCFEDKEKEPSYPRLSDKIKGVKPCLSLSLDKVFTAQTITQACSWLPFINDDESIITPDCCWMGKGWLRITGVECQKEVGILASQQELNSLNQALIYAENELSLLKMKRDELFVAKKDNEEERLQIQRVLTDGRDKLRACETIISNQEHQLQQLLANKARFGEEQEDLTSRLEEMVMQQDGIEQSLQEALAQRLFYQEKYNQLSTDKSDWDALLTSRRQAVEEARSQFHQLELQGEREQLLIAQLSNNIAREELRLDKLNERLESIAQKLLSLEIPDASVNGNLQDKLSKHRELEASLAHRREELSEYARSLEALEAETKTQEKHAKAVLETIQQHQLQVQALVVRANNLLESLSELDKKVDDLLMAIPSDITVCMREDYLHELVEKIMRLGAINLAAIEEYETESQRKQYLDEQYDDLTLALNTLDSAIEKMDKETKQRLQQTFDEVNRSFQSLFPRLFGGGRAMLELTCDNLLEAGILVMAQPPGKRNSTIHLLSGGEKAMTAVALVFAIFQLNPSPFCMLDEVDAPLDDANVGRFCSLVKEMSQFVQFLFITHNKLTMELADHLIGVTMREPGVSRVVAVDVDQALAMTES